jgi:hypothetical protein
VNRAIDPLANRSNAQMTTLLQVQTRDPPAARQVDRAIDTLKKLNGWPRGAA